MKLYERFFSYISAARFISAIFQIYQRNSVYIGDSPNISAQLNLYRRFFSYIDLLTKPDNLRKKKEAARYGSLPHF
ncbi:hypothetical protein P5G86_20245 [Paenibacillus jamilae]|uniref:hypothetical protein n=1 Tax=Bacillus cereus group sp. BfR-BA-01356 TaxID=2920319 RepID=UPI001F5AE4A9|nr:hypothetical protein [Paenibacillus jamilae]MEB9278487.1 hypothetical protein [Bacillus cereus]